MIPYKFEISLAEELFEIEVHYVTDFDFFTIDLFKNKESLVYGEKIVYGVPLFNDVADSRFPKVQIVPLDDSGRETELNWSTLSETVFLNVYEDSDT
ncbi:hypothetical protein HQN90_17830 [Paenibacillus alba]|nr:hypothetical protein [Paenibacillus alba]